MPDTARFKLKPAGCIPARPESRKAVMAYRLIRLSRRLAWVSLAFSATLPAGCSTPIHLSDFHVTSAPWSPALDVAGLVCQPVAALGPVAAPGIQGLSATVSYALTSALSQASPPIRTMPMPEMVNRLTDQGLAGEYVDMLSGAARGGILERERLRRIGAALGSRYVLQPGLAEFNQTVLDKFEFSGLKIVRTRVLALRLWLQLWGTQTGHLLWESTGEVTVAAPILALESTVSLAEIAQKLWSRMIEDGLLGTKTESPRCP
jgi:hypothetical protein